MYLTNWILCIPKVLDLDETSWWTKWKAKQVRIHNKPPEFISIMTGNEIIDLMKAYGIYDLVFEIEESIWIREIHESVTSLTNSFDPRKKGLPSIKWETYIGKQKWKNTPLIIGNKIFVGSAGNKWNASDENDGIYCIDINTGQLAWVYQTNSDVNELSYFDGVIVGGCDDGIVHCVSSKTGALKWKQNVGSGVISKIFKCIGFNEERLIVVTYDAEIFQLDLKRGSVLEQISLEGHIMSNIKVIESRGSTTLFVPTIEGNLYELRESFGSISLISKTLVKYPDEYSASGYSVAQLYSSPIVYQDKLLIGFTRQTYYDYPAVVCLDIKTKRVLWYGKDASIKESHFGNIRTDLIVENNEVIFTHPYSNELVGLCTDTGEVKWKTKLGRQMFQQWASPVLGDHGYYLPRHDGYLYKVDRESKERIWGVYLGESEDAGVVFDRSQEVGNENERAAWNLFKGHSLLSTPCILENILIVGSDEGILYCLSDI